MKKHNKVKYVLITIMVIIACGVLLPNLWKNNEVLGYSYTDPDTNLTWYFTKSGNKAYNLYLTSGTVSGDTLVIPSKVTYAGSEYEVASIRGYSTSSSTSYSERRNILYNSKKEVNNNTIKTIVLPSTLLTIDNNTFCNFSALEQIVIPNSVTNIGAYAFYSCTALKSINLGGQVQIIGDYAFYNCKAITSLDLGSSLRQIGTNAFYNCNSITGTVTIPDSTTYLGNYAFGYCSQIEKVVIGKGITTINSRAFYSCSNMTNVDISSSVTTIDNTAFSNCEKLENINVDENNSNYSSIDGIVFNKDKTILILCPIGNNQTNYVIPSTVKEISDSAFYNCNNIRGSITLSENLEKIGNSAFSYCENISGTLVIPNTVTSIGSNAFYRCIGLKGLELSENLQTIGSSAFYDCTGLQGDLIISDSVTSIGSSAFKNCSLFDGILKIGNGLTTIENQTFQGSGNFYKAIVGSNVTSIGYESFSGFSDIWVENEATNVTLNTYFAGSVNNTYVHWLGCKHNITISTLPGIQIINVDTMQPVVSGEYNCETKMNYKIEIQDGYNYNNLKLVRIMSNDDTQTSSVDLDLNKTYTLEKLTRDYAIYVQAISPKAEFEVKTYIEEVNRNKLPVSRVPVAEIKDGKVEYKKIENAVQVKPGDLITCKVRVYNKGLLAGNCGIISLLVPEGFKLPEGNRTNEINGWQIDSNGNANTSILNKKSIKGYDGTTEAYFEEIDVVLEVTADKSEEEKTYEYTVKLGDSEDTDKILLSEKVKVDYTININKIDGDTKELLAGAEFALKDENGNILRKSTTDNNGVLSFGLITTYGEGQDIYYIEEIGAPEGYVMAKQTQIKVTVTKIITDEEKGAYSVKVVCEVLDYNVDITRYEYTPIKTKEQLAKVGSGETVIIDGVEYKYNIDTNYKLMNDIDLSGMEWTPINHEIKGIIDGNNHKISNMTITSTEEYGITEVGLFRSFAGIIENLTLENVNIDIQAISEDAFTISGYPCVGGFAGYMVEGTIKNCTVTGNISAVTDNIGGFVGHTAKEYMVKMQNCTNSANVTGKQGSAIRNGSTSTVKSSNVGGLIGCALGALRITDCTNTGKISNTNYNVGGLVGFIQSTDYREVNIYADFDEADRIIELAVENRRTYGKYDIVLENIDATTLGLIEGGVYTILDKDKNVLNNCENVQLEKGRLKVGTVDINNLGLDTYYIKEIKPADGYEGLQGTVKLEVSRYWDKEAQEYKVSVDTVVLTEKETTTDEPIISELPSSSSTGNIFTKVNFENVSWNVNKAEIKNSKNTGAVSSTYMNAGGILGTTYSIIEIDNCSNTGSINVADISESSYSYEAKAGGIVSEIRTEGLNKFCKISNCTNSGTVMEGADDSGNQYGGGTGAVGGIVAQAIGDVEIVYCENTGDVKSTEQSGVGGIIGDAQGILIVENCKNFAKLTTINNSVTAPVGGIIGKAYVYDSEQRKKINVYVDNCESAGDIFSGTHTGGIIGITDGVELQINNCSVHDISIEDINGDKGGIVGLVSSDNIKIENCNVDNVEFVKQQVISWSAYGANGGIVGNLSVCASSWNASLEYVYISNCKVTNSKIHSRTHEAGGIIGQTYGTKGQTYIYIYDCTSYNNEIINYLENNTTYSNSAGIFAAVYEGGNITIENCLVEKCKIASQYEGSTSEYDQNVSGIFGIGFYCDSLSVKNCDVIECDLVNKASTNDSCANAGGIIGEIGISSNKEDCFEVSKCNVIDTNITTNAGNLGGIISVYYGSSASEEYEEVISECTVSGGTFISTANTYANTCTGGIIADFYSSGYYEKIKLENCIVDNMTIKGNGRNTAGLVAVSHSNAEITDCKLANSNIENLAMVDTNSSYMNYPNDCVAGLLGYANGDATFNNNVVESCNIKGITLAANVSGICGAVLKGVVANNCHVLNSNIYSNTNYNKVTYNSTSSGMFSRIAGDAKIENCSIKETVITGEGSAIAAILASGNNANINNCVVEEVEIYDNLEEILQQWYTRSIGGIFATVTGNVSFANCSVKGLKVDSHTKTVGGIGGYASTLQKAENCTVDNANISNDLPNNILGGTIAGIIGDISNTACVINNCKTINSILIGTSENIAGIIGSGNYLKISECTVDNVDLINENKYDIPDEQGTEYPYDMGSVGGIISFAAGDTTIDNCKVENSKLEARLGEASNRNVGGLIGFSYNTTIKDSRVYNTEIINNTQYGSIGGLSGNINYVYGNTPRTLTVNNSGIEKTNITGVFKVGGILGFGKIIAEDGYIKESTINGSVETGGIIGNGLSESKINTANVTDSTITSNYRAAGIAGFAPFNILNSNVTNSKITVGGQNNGEAAGIVSSATLSTSKVDKCNVTGSTITNNTNGYTGGIAAFANNTISECNVTDSTITSNGASANGLGGIVGQGSNYTNTLTYIYKCIVSGCTLTGNNAVGGIAGAGVANIEECSVIGEVIEEETTVESVALEESAQEETTEVITPEIVEEGTQEESLNQVGEEYNITPEEEITKTSTEETTETKENAQSEELESSQNIAQQIVAQSVPKIVKVYSSKIIGKNNVGGILGDAGILASGNTFATLINCNVKGTEISGLSKVTESIGRNSYYTEDETAIYDVLTNFIKENCNIIIIEN